MESTRIVVEILSFIKGRLEFITGLPEQISSARGVKNTIKNIPKQDIWAFYDSEADALWINYHQPALIADDSELTENGILIRYQNDEIIGLTILNVTQQL